MSLRDHLRVIVPAGNTAFFKNCSSGGELLAPLRPIWRDRDLKFKTSTSKKRVCARRTDCEKIDTSINSFSLIYYKIFAGPKVQYNLKNII